MTSFIVRSCCQGVDKLKFKKFQDVLVDGDFLTGLQKHLSGTTRAWLGVLQAMPLPSCSVGGLSIFSEQFSLWWHGPDTQILKWLNHLNQKAWYSCQISSGLAPPKNTPWPYVAIMLHARQLFDTYLMLPD